MVVKIFNTNEKLFDMIIMRSFFKNPYDTQHISPIKRDISIISEIFCALFSLTNLQSWGSKEIPVKMLASTPITVTFSTTLRF